MKCDLETSIKVCSSATILGESKGWPKFSQDTAKPREHRRDNQLAKDAFDFASIVLN
jgi:hypothetical protein